jgi:succinyl-CoA synthetase beta subunit
VLVGGRGLAGGIKTASNPDELKEVADALFNSEIKGMPVRKALLCQKVDIARELYLASPLTVIRANRSCRQYRGWCPYRGDGKDITGEDSRHPHRTIIRLLSLPGRSLLRMLASSRSSSLPGAEIIGQLYQSPRVRGPHRRDQPPRRVIERCPDGRRRRPGGRRLRPLRIVFPCPTHVDRIENPLERRGREIGVTYVDSRAT